MPYQESDNALLSDRGAVRSLKNEGRLPPGGPRPSFSVNLRDIGTASEKIKPDVVFRSSQVVSTRELAALNIQTVLDLRQAPVLCKAQRRNFWQSIRRGWLSLLGLCCCWGPLGQAGDPSVTPSRSGSASLLTNPALQRSESSRRLLPAREQAQRAIKHAAPCWRCTVACRDQYGVDATVFHVDLLPRGVSLHIFLDLPRKLQAKVLVCALKGEEPEQIVAGAVADPEIMGYLRLYQILLERSKGNLARALRLFADPGSYPVLVHCIHGKDRTGLVVMLVLLLCGVEPEVIIQDYAMSEAHLREGRENRHLAGLREWMTTDQVIASSRHVMEATIAHIHRNYGSAQRYALDIGLSPREIAAIRRNLLKDENS